MPELAFDQFVLDTDRKLLLRDGKVVDLQPLVFELISFLARRPGRTISRAELLPAVWRTSFVTETVVARAVMKARRALFDDAQSPRLLRTVPRVGYLFDTAVQERSASNTVKLKSSLAGARHRLALLPISDLTGNPSLSWVSSGLTALLHQWIEEGGLNLVREEDVQHIGGSNAERAPPEGQGAVEAIRAQLTASGAEFKLQAWRGSATAGHEIFEARGADIFQLARRLACTITGQIALSASSEVDGFWLEQFATVVSYRQSGAPERALTLLESCLPHLPQTLSLTLLHARLLRECGQLEAAITAVDTALASPETPPQSLARLELLALRAQCKFDADLLAEARADFEQAIELSEVIDEALSLRPDLLSRAARTAGRLLDAKAAICWSETAVEEAERLGQVDVQARAWLVLAAMLRAMDLPHRAKEAALHAYKLAERSGVTEYQARALRAQAAIHHYQREYQEALVQVRKSIALWVRSGDRAAQLWTRLFEATILVDAQAFQEAGLVCADLAAQPDLQMAHRAYLQYLSAQIAWGDGQTVLALERLRKLTHAARASKTLFIQVAHAELVLMAIHLGHLNEAKEALTAASGLQMVGALERRLAALALAEGDRAQAVANLRKVWDGGQGMGFEGPLIAVDLGWLLLETAPLGFQDPTLEGLFAYLSDFSEHPPEIRVFRAGYLLRQQPDAHHRDEWDATVASVPALRLRSSPMLTKSYREAMASRSPPRLRELLSRVCR